MCVRVSVYVCVCVCTKTYVKHQMNESSKGENLMRDEVLK